MPYCVEKIDLKIRAFHIHAISKYILRTHSVPDTVLGLGAGNDDQTLALVGASIEVWVTSEKLEGVAS